MSPCSRVLHQHALAGRRKRQRLCLPAPSPTLPPSMVGIEIAAEPPPPSRSVRGNAGPPSRWKNWCGEATGNVRSPFGPPRRRPRPRCRGDAGAVLDAGRHVDRKRASRVTRPGPNSWDRIVDHGRGPDTDAGPLGVKKPGCDAPAAPPQVRQVFSLSPPWRQRPAGLARHRCRDAHLCGLAGVSFLERDLHVVAQVRRSRPPPSPSAAEQVSKCPRRSRRNRRRSRPCAPPPCSKAAWPKRS